MNGRDERREKTEELGDSTTCDVTGEKVVCQDVGSSTNCRSLGLEHLGSQGICGASSSSMAVRECSGADRALVLVALLGESGVSDFALACVASTCDNIIGEAPSLNTEVSALLSDMSQGMSHRKAFEELMRETQEAMKDVLT